MGGVLLALLMPLLGALAGAYYLSRDDERRSVGAVTLGLSVFGMVLYAIALRGA